MNNNEIIINAIIENEIMTEAQVEEYLEQGKMPPVHTYKAWQAMGYQVKRGEKAKVKTSIWNRSTKPSKEQKVAIEAGELDHIKPYFYMAPAHLFTEDQVERLEDMGKVKRPAKKAKKAPAKKAAAKKAEPKKATKKATKAPAKKTKTAANAVQCQMDLDGLR